MSDDSRPRTVTAWPEFDVERRSVRVVLLDPDDRLLLFHTIDPTMPETGQWWELPGGGVEDGEVIAATAVREVAEESGIVLDAAAVGEPLWRRSTTYARRFIRTLQHEVVVVARLDGPPPDVRGNDRTPNEREEYLDARWWPVSDVIGSGERFFPASLPAMLGPLLAGHAIDEPFEMWN